MIVYRITTEKYSKVLSSSGASNRWNEEGQFVIYAAESRSLASLELMVHRSGIKLQQNYKVLVIEVEATRKLIKTIKKSILPEKWRNLSAYSQLQEIGTEWYRNREKLVMKIPSAVIPQENNYVINTKHELFKSNVKIVDVENYFWDERLL